MIQFKDSTQMDGEALVQRVGFQQSDGRYLLNASFELPVVVSTTADTLGGKTVWKRSPLDYLTTGPKGPQGNKPCHHFSLDGSIELKPPDASLTLHDAVYGNEVNLDRIDPTCILSLDPDRTGRWYWSDTSDANCIISADERRRMVDWGVDTLYAIDWGGISPASHSRPGDQAAGSGCNTWVLFTLTDTTRTPDSDAYPSLFWSRTIGYRGDGTVITESGFYTYVYWNGRGTAVITVQAHSLVDGNVVGRGWTPTAGWTKTAGTSYYVTTWGLDAARRVWNSKGASLSRISSTPSELWLARNQCTDGDCNATITPGPAASWSDVLIDEAMNLLCAQAVRIQAEPGRPEYDPRALHDDIMDRIPYFNGNMLAYVRDVRDILGTAVGIARLIDDPSKATAASAWLSTRYGTRLTVTDTKEILSGIERKALDSIKAKTAKVKGIKEFGWEKLRARHSDEWEVAPLDCFTQCRVHYNSTVQYRRDDLGPVMNMTRNLIEWDAIPDAQNIWDLIPYSFVVDWIVDVESVMDGIDRRLESACYTILSVVDSSKMTAHIDMLPPLIENIELLVSVDLRDYHRSVSQTLSFTPFRISAGHLAAKNVLDGVALLVGRA